MKIWTSKWPERAGTYWFYGTQFEKVIPNSKPELCFVEVFKISNGFVYVSNGSFLYKSQSSGVWQEAELPELPKE
jgi:hypothetical protein